MDLDKLMMNKFLDSFEKQTKAQLSNKLNMLFSIIWSDDKLKEKLLNKVNIDFGDIVATIKKDVEVEEELIDSEKVLLKKKQQMLELQRKERIKQQKQKEWEEREEQKERGETIQKDNLKLVDGLNKDNLMEESIKDVIKRDLSENPVEETNESDEVEALPPLDEEPKQKSDIDSMMD